jgi:D-threonate/D-erythronate kinase
VLAHFAQTIYAGSTSLALVIQRADPADDHRQISEGAWRLVSAISGATTTQRMRSLVILGDDLSGTTESVAAASSGGAGHDAVHLRLGSFLAHTAHSDGLDGGRCVAVDLDVRQASPATAHDRYAAAVHATLRHGRSDVLLLKVDSLLRGNIAAACAVVPPASHRPVVLAPALPAQGRRTVGGKVDLVGRERPVPGALEGARVDVAAAAGRPTALVDLHVVRAGTPALSRALGQLAAQGVVAVCDAETDEDLDAVAAASLQHRHPVIVGAGGVAAALGRALRRDLTESDGGPGGTVVGCGADPLEPDASVLVVVGTAEPSARPQVVRLQQAGAVVQDLEPLDGGPAAETVDALDKALRTGCGVLQVAPGPVAEDRSSRLLGRLADTAAAVLARQTAARLVLTGGATARAVLTRMRIDTLHLQCQVHPGAAHLRTDDGRHVVTRPGSHGEADSLALLASHLGGSISPHGHSVADHGTPSTEGQR